jgi:hypothetical protein
MEKSELNSKYYTPTIDEFHVGFEYEWNGWKEKGIFGKCQVEDIYYFDELRDDLFYGEVRVKYLDREDIESLRHKNNDGFTTFFKVRSEDDNEIVFQTYWVEEDQYLDEEYIYWDIKYNRIKITHKSKTLFWGKIKNKSELKVLLKQLGIYEDQKSTK